MASRKPHRSGTYETRATRVVSRANTNPSTQCWRCGRTLAQHPRHKNGRRAFWTAGHLRDGEIDGELRPEASTCNYTAGAIHGNRQRTNPTSRNW